MILELDIGNTRGKWRLLEGAQCLERGLFDDIGKGFSGLPLHSGVKRVRVACVAGEVVEENLRQWVRRHLNLECAFARTSSEVAGLSNCYEQPEQMGVDRWLAAVAAFHIYQSAMLVIDLGSALNAELVDAHGHHLGGYIIPGARLMEEALLAGTEQVRFDGEDILPFSMVPGRSTAESVNHGISIAMVGAIQQIISQAQKALPQGFNIVLTGGGAQSVRPYLPDTLDWRPDLVLDGLRFLLP